jgi:hypothetical protein
MQVKKIWAMSALAVVTMLTACGGGGGSTAGGTTPSLSGTVAVGTPMAYATITVKDGAGNTKTATTDTNGKYTISDVSALKAPLMLQAKGKVTGSELTLHSVLETTPAAGSVLNATPATEAITAHAIGDPATVFASANQINDIRVDDLKAAKAKLTEALADILIALGKDSKTVDLFTTQFNADNTGLDKLLDFVTFEGDSTNMRLANKNTGANIAVTKTDTTPAKLPTLTDAEKNLDTKSIKDLMASLNDVLGTEASIQAGMPSLISEDFLQEGDKKVESIKQYASYLVGAKYTEFLIRSCDASNKVCYVNFAITKKNGIVAIDPTAVKYENNKWVLYGDRSPFIFDLKPVVSATYSVNNGDAQAPRVKVGMNLYIPTSENTSNTTSYYSAKLFYRTTRDSGSWVLLETLRSAAACGFLTIDGNNCSNFIEVNDTSANTLNAAASKGQYQLRIEILNAQNVIVEQFEIMGTKLFTDATARTAINNSGLGITAADLGTDKVRFTGTNIEFLDIGVTSVNSTSWEEDDIFDLNKSVSVADAYTKCKNDTQRTYCDQAFGTGTTINRVMLVTRDLEGRAIWKTYNKQP